MQDKIAKAVLSRRTTLLAGAAMIVAAMPARAEDALKVGMSGPFSGGLSLLGQSVRDGVEVAFAEINAQGGVGGRKLVFIAEDDGYEPMRTIASTISSIGMTESMSAIASCAAVSGPEPGSGDRSHFALPW